MIRPGLILRFAARELRGGLRGFRVFLFCLALGVAAIAAVGSVRMAVTEGLGRDGRALLGGDVEASFTYRGPTGEERAWIAARSEALSETIELRSMATRGEARALTMLKAVDGAYPLVGAVELDPALPLSQALETRDGLPGAAMERELAARLGAGPGDIVKLGGAEFELRAILKSIPDRGGGFIMAPLTLTGLEALRATGLAAEGSLYETEVRALTAQAGLSDSFADAFPQAGARWRDSADPAPGLARFLDRIGAFLILIGLAALAVGGLGVSAAVRRQIEEKTESIAVLKTLGARGWEVFAIHLAQIGALAVLGVALGLALGGGGGALLGPLLADQAPVPALFSLYPVPLAQAALFGLLTALAFSLPPLARARAVRPAALFRDLAAPEAFPRGAWIAAGVAALALAAAAASFSGSPRLALWFCAGLAGALVALWLAGTGLRALAAKLAHGRLAQGRPSLRLALAALGAPGGETVSALLSLGLGLTVLAAIGQIDSNLRSAIAGELPARAPAFFFVDIQNDQLDPFKTIVTERADSVESAPMLRGVITSLKGVPADDAEIDPEAAWILDGDRGVTYAAAPPPGTEITDGAWWPEDYAGPPLVSFSAEHGALLGLKLGDEIGVSVLGREIRAEIASFRRVEFRDMGINFLMVFSPNVFAGAPHAHIATVYAPPEAEGPLLRAVGAELPNVTAIGVRDAIARVSEGLGRLAAAARWAAGAVLLAGVAVLIGAAATGARRRSYEAAVLKTLGATRARILSSFALRAGLTGAAAGALAAAVGIVAGWAVMRFVMEAAFTPDFASAALIVLGGAAASLLTGLVFSAPALRARPARVLRSRE